MKVNVSYAAKVLPAAISALALTFLGGSGAWAQQSGATVSQQLVGVWKLVGDSNTGKDGVKKVGAAWGPNPQGKIIFTSTGHFVSLNNLPNIPKFASGSRMQGTAEENKSVVQGSLASAGTYTVSADGKVLTQKIEGSSWPGWSGTEQVRNLTISGDDLRYTLIASFGGTSEVIYKRVK